MDALITADGTHIDLTEGVPVPLNLSIADFKHPEKRQRNFSKEIELPGTAANQLFFSSAFSFTKIGGAYNFNSSQKVNCTYYKRGTPVLPNAVLKLNKVILRDKNIIFKVGLFSDVVDIFLLLSRVSIRDLDWDAYNHTMNNATIIASWTTPIGQGYYYPLIVRKERPDPLMWLNVDMVPYVHYVDVFKKCMDFVGQPYTSAHLATTRSKSKLFGYGGGTFVDAALSDAERNNRKVLTTNGIFTKNQTAQAGATQVSTSGPANFPPVPFTGNTTITEVQDIYSQMDVVTFTAARTGAMRLEITGQVRFIYSGPDITYVSGGNRTLYYAKNGVQYPIVELIQTSTNQFFNLNTSTAMDLQQGDQIELFWGITSVQVSWPIPDDSDTTVNLAMVTSTPLQINFISTQTAITEGATMEMRRFLPDMKCSDFLIGAIRFENLMISDPDLYGVVKIEPVRDFYQDTSVFTDISEEVDISKDIEIRPSANEFAKTLQWEFKAGTETDAKDYEVTWDKTYGDLSFDQSSFYAKGEQKIQLPFGTILPYQLYDSLGPVIVPRFINVDANGTIKPTTGVPRVMFRNGMKPGKWLLRAEGGMDTLFEYPSVHHFNNWTAPTFDLNFQLVDELLHAATLKTTVNTYSEYYKAEIDEIIDPNGKYVQLYRKMNERQVKELDWSRLLMWNGALFKFNKIVDYDSAITQVTKIEMLQVLKANNQ